MNLGGDAVQDITLSREVVLIDLSSLAYPLWHVSQNEPDPNWTSTQTVARVRALASGQPHVAVCADSGRSFRRDITPTYKAQRPESDGTREHQINLAIETLVNDGFPVWAVKGFEADDVIASAAMRAEANGLRVLVVTDDKDLCQLVGSAVRVKRLRDDTVRDEAGVVATFGVRSDQMLDYLALIGDASDNIAGAKGIGPKRAAELLGEYQTLEAVYAALKSNGTSFKPSIATSLQEFRQSGALQMARQLIALRTDVEIPFEEIMAERAPKDIVSIEEFEPMEEEASQDAVTSAGVGTASAPKLAEDEVGPRTGNGSSVDTASSVPNGGDSGRPTALTVREPEVLAQAPAEWERQLDPRSMRDARILAEDMFKSRLFSAYGTPHGVLSTVMLGRELGLPAMASLRGIHIIEGRHALSAHLMVALVLKSGLAEYFEPISFSDTEATFETKRKGARNPVKLTHTIEMAKTAGLVKDKSGWQKNPSDMLVARAQSRLARMVYPDLLAGLYSPDELSDLRNEAA